MKLVALTAFFIFLAIAKSEAGPSFSSTVGGNTYNFADSIVEKKGKQCYYVNITYPNGVFKTILVTNGFGQQTHESFRKTLSDALHKDGIFLASATSSDVVYDNIETVINLITAMAMPNLSPLLVDSQIINDNNILRLFKNQSNGVYLLTNKTPGSSISLVNYGGLAATPNSYVVAWASLAGSQIIKDNFDKFLKLYYTIPTTADKPILYLAPANNNTNYQVFYSYDGHTAMATGLYITRAVGKKVLGAPIETLTVAGASASFFEIKSPLEPRPLKKIDESIPREEQ